VTESKSGAHKANKARIDNMWKQKKDPRWSYNGNGWSKVREFDIKHMPAETCYLVLLPHPRITRSWLAAM